MLVSTNWLESFFARPLTKEERASLPEKLTLHVAEVDSVKEQGAHLGAITVAHIQKIEPHPDAEKLRLATVEIAPGKSQRVVCGAPNIEVGQKVPYAPLGTTFPNGLTLEAKKIRGIVSEGMLCSQAELEIGEDQSGIFILPPESAVGAPIAHLLKVHPDLIVDIDNKAITHRPDLWGHAGVARECAAVLDVPYKQPCDCNWLKEKLSSLPTAPSPIPVKVDKASCAIGYFGLAVDGVRVAPSPAWMQERLLAVGLRPINNLVDIGNYVMLELGGPLHIFDRTKIAKNEIHIRPAKAGESLTLLDGEEIALTPQDTVVADGEKPLVLAGIKGGLESGVSEGTTTIFIEAATWERTQIRKSSSRHGVRTDSSQRFEKGIDPHLMERSVLRAYELVQELCPGAKAVGALAYDGEDLSALRPPVLQCSVGGINSLLGTAHSLTTIQTTLESLGFQVEKRGDDDALQVIVPSFRATREFLHEADLAEEVGRVLGYGNITPTPPVSPIRPTSPLPIHTVEKRARSFLTQHGRFLEVETYPLIGEKLLELYKWPTPAALRLKNPLSLDQAVMRPSMLPSLLAAVRENAKHFDAFRVFEVARSYHTGNGTFSEERRELTLAVYKNANATNEDLPTPFRALIDTMEPLLERLGCPVQCVPTEGKFPHPLLPLEWEGRHPFLSRTFNAYGKAVGEVTEVHPMLLKELKIRGSLALGVISLDPIAERVGSQKIHYKPLSRFPSSTFDCTVVAKPKSELEELFGALRRYKLPEVLDRAIVTEFCPSKEERYITVRFTFGSDSETLSGEKIKQLEDGALAHLKKSGYPLKEG